MRALQLLILFPLLLLMGCEANISSSDSEEVVPPEYQDINRRLMFAEGISGNDVMYAISRDKRLLAAVSSSLLQIWDIAAKRVMGEYPVAEHDRPLKVCFSGSDEELLVRTKNKLAVWDRETKSWGRTLEDIVEVSRNMKFAVQRDRNSNLRVFSLSNVDSTIVRAYYRPNQIAFSPNERFFTSLDDGEGGSIVYDLEEDTRVFNGKIKTTVRRIVLSNDGKKIAGQGTPGSQLVLIGLAGTSSSSIFTTKMTEVEQAAKHLVFSSNSNFLCIDTYKPGLRIYDTRNLRAVFEANGLVVEEQSLIDDNTILYTGYNREILALDQQTLKPLDTIERVMNGRTFHSFDNQVFARIKRGSFFLEDRREKTVDTLRLRSLRSEDAYEDRFASTELIRSVETIYAYPFANFDLKNLKEISGYDLAKRNTDFIPDDSHSVNARLYSPNWKYKLEGNKIMECATGEVILELSLDLSSEWSSTYSLSEERLMLRNFKLQHVVIVDLIDRSVLVNKELPNNPVKVLFSPSGDFYIEQNRADLKSIEFFELGRKIPLPYWSSIYNEYQSTSDIQISANGKYIGIGISSYRGSPESSLWSTETGRMVYRSGSAMALLPQDGEIILQYTDSIKRISTLNGLFDVVWAVPIEGRISRLKAAANGKYFTYMKDGTYHCFADLQTGKELWQLGVSSNRDYFVKSSEYPIVYTNHDKFLQQFSFEDPLTGEAVYPSAEELRDTSEYLVRLTRQYLD